MWSNTAPDGGLVIVGIEDKTGTFIGCHGLSQDQLNEREKSAFIFCSEAKVESKRVPVVTPDGTDSFLLVFRVFYRDDKVVVNSSGQAFIRIGDSKHELTAEEIRELQIDKGQLDFEQEPAPLVFPGDFDSGLVRRYIDSLKIERKPLQDHSDEELLEHRHLGRRKGPVFCPNNACALLLSKDPMSIFAGCKIRFLRVDGDFERTGDQYNIVKDIRIEGPIPNLIEEAAQVLGSQLREFSRLGPDGKFFSASEYPKDAWYEALVNACVHRSYGLRNMPIVIKMFDDKLVVESPGGFPPTVTPATIYGAHHPRNPFLMEALFYLGLVKEHGEGAKRIRDTMTRMELPFPEFEQSMSGTGATCVRVTLRNNVKQRRFWVDSGATKVLGEALLKNLSSEEKRVLNFVLEYGSINVSECLHLIPTLPKWHAAKTLLERMKKGGLLDRRHTRPRDPHSRYILPRTIQLSTDQNEE
jgi:ATP-dependent DNA helicase RecG